MANRMNVNRAYFRYALAVLTLLFVLFTVFYGMPLVLPRLLSSVTPSAALYAPLAGYVRTFSLFAYALTGMAGVWFLYRAARRP